MSYVPQPELPKIVTLEMTGAEAQTLMNLTYFSNSIPALFLEHARNDGGVGSRTFLEAVDTALTGVDVRRRP